MLLLLHMEKLSQKGLKLLASKKRSRDNKTRQMPEINDVLSLTNLSIFSPIINSF